MFFPTHGLWFHGCLLTRKPEASLVIRFSCLRYVNCECKSSVTTSIWPFFFPGKLFFCCNFHVFSSWKFTGFCFEISTTGLWWIRFLRTRTTSSSFWLIFWKSTRNSQENALKFFLESLSKRYYHYFWIINADIDLTFINSSNPENDVEKLTVIAILFWASK